MTNALQERFAGLMDGLGVADREWSGGVAAGVSGGADSTALAVLLAGWAAARGIPFLAITCDHGLRPEAAAETDAVAALMRGIGARCRVLRLGLSKGTAIQERARDARYGAMLDAIRREGIGILAVGHHRMDQAETVEHRLRSGGGGPSSLAGMLPVRAAEDAILVRPLLPCWPADMRSFLLDAGIPWVEESFQPGQPLCAGADQGVTGRGPRAGRVPAADRRGKLRTAGGYPQRGRGTPGHGWRHAACGRRRVPGPRRPWLGARRGRGVPPNPDGGNREGAGGRRQAASRPAGQGRRKYCGRRPVAAGPRELGGARVDPPWRPLPWRTTGPRGMAASGSVPVFPLAWPSARWGMRTRRRSGSFMAAASPTAC